MFDNLTWYIAAEIPLGRKGPGWKVYLCFMIRNPLDKQDSKNELLGHSGAENLGSAQTHKFALDTKYPREYWWRA